MSRYTAGHATYPGDVRHMVGEVKGPTTYGSPVVAIAAAYDHAANKTRVTFAHLTDDDRVSVEQLDGSLRLPDLTHTK